MVVLVPELALPVFLFPSQLFLKEALLLIPSGENSILELFASDPARLAGEFIKDLVEPGCLNGRSLVIRAWHSLPPCIFSFFQSGAFFEKPPLLNLLLVHEGRGFLFTLILLISLFFSILIRLLLYLRFPPADMLVMLFDDHASMSVFLNPEILRNLV